MESLVDYIAQRHSLPRENLATEMLVYILRSADRQVLRNLLTHYGADLDNGELELETQRRGERTSGIPDARIVSESGSPCALIENKFYANFTDNQPNGYLTELV